MHPKEVKLGEKFSENLQYNVKLLKGCSVLPISHKITEKWSHNQSQVAESSSVAYLQDEISCMGKYCKHGLLELSK